MCQAPSGGLHAPAATNMINTMPVKPELILDDPLTKAIDMNEHLETDFNLNGDGLITPKHQFGTRCDGKTCYLDMPEKPLTIETCALNQASMEHLNKDCYCNTSTQKNKVFHTGCACQCLAR